MTADRPQLNDIKDHEHSLRRINKRRCPDLGGATVTAKCSDPDCDYFVSEWQSDEQTGLQEFAST